MIKENKPDCSDKRSVVFFTKEITSMGLLKAYEALGRKASGNVAVKMSMGEPGGHYFLSPTLIGDFVSYVNGAIVDANTAYGGSRDDTASHYKVAANHGFSDIAPVVILDEKGELKLPVKKGKHLTVDIVGAAFADFDFHIVLSHFKGHAMGGLGGAIKNMSIGYASPDGKRLIHSSGHSTQEWEGGTQDSFLETMAEAASAVADQAENCICYINIMNNLSVDCDCDSNPAPPTMQDIGIAASLDPVAIDQACVDLIYGAGDGEDLIERIESRSGLHCIAYAEEIGLGRRTYKLKNIDDI